MIAQPNNFRYYLTLENKRTEIIFAPEGWDTNSVISYKRSNEYAGLIRSFALPMEFVMDGADVLRKAYYTYGIEAEVRIEVEQLQKGLNLDTVWAYKMIFRGDVDFSEFKDYKDHVSVTLMESGVAKEVKAYESVKYEYPLFGDDVVNVVLPGVEFVESYESIIQAVTTTSQEHLKYIPGTIISLGKGSFGFITGQSANYENVQDNSFAGSSNWFVKYEREVALKITGHIKGSYRRGSTGSNTAFSIRIMDSNNNTLKTLFNQPGTAATRVNFDFDVNETITASAGTKLFLYFRIEGSDTFNKGIYIDDYNNNINVSIIATSDPSNCKGIPAPALFKRIIQKLSPGSMSNSNLLNNTYPNLIFTSGDGIREIADAKIKITFKEFFDTINGIDDAGFGIENRTAVLENANYFFRNLKVLDLGEVKECSIQPAQEFLFNSIKIGYNDGNTDDVDGKQEYNSTQEWQLPITRVQKERNWISPTRADQYGIEKIRVDYSVRTDKKTNDTPSDNDSFMIYCFTSDGYNYHPERGDSYASVTGLLSGGSSAYNLHLTPKQNLLRKQGYLAGVMDRMPGRFINFASGRKNTELATVKFGKVVQEDEDIISSSLVGKYFIPNIATIVTKMPKDTMWLMDNMMFGYVQFKYRETILKGYLMDVPIDVARNTEQTLKLLLTNDNNLLNLA